MSFATFGKIHRFGGSKLNEYICQRARVYVCLCVYVSACPCVYVCVCVCARARVCVRAGMCVYVPACVRACVCMCVRACLTERRGVSSRAEEWGAGRVLNCTVITVWWTLKVTSVQWGLDRDCSSARVDQPRDVTSLDLDSAGSNC